MPGAGGARTLFRPFAAQAPRIEGGGTLQALLPGHPGYPRRLPAIGGVRGHAQSDGFPGGLRPALDRPAFRDPLPGGVRARAPALCAGSRPRQAGRPARLSPGDCEAMKSLRSRLILGSALVAVVPLAIVMFLLSQRVGALVREQAAG